MVKNFTNNTAKSNIYVIITIINRFLYYSLQ